MSFHLGLLNFYVVNRKRVSRASSNREGRRLQPPAEAATRAACLEMEKESSEVLEDPRPEITTGHKGV